MPTPSTTTQVAPKVRNTYTKEFKTQAVALARRSGMTIRQAATDLGNNESMLRTWAKSADMEGPEAFRGHGVRTEIEARLAALELENRILREERDILKKRDGILREGAPVKYRFIEAHRPCGTSTSCAESSECPSRATSAGAMAGNRPGGRQTVPCP